MALEGRGNVEKSLLRMASIDRGLKVATTVALVMYVLFFLVAVFLVFIGESASGVGKAASLFPMILVAVIGWLVLFTIRQTFVSIEEKQSPFSEGQSRRLVVVGVLLLVDVVIEAAASALGLSVVSVVNHTDLSASAAHGTTVLNFNVVLFLAAIVSFWLAYLFKYGTLLQWLYDDTV